MARFCIDRHMGKVCALFMDSTVRPVGLKELWTLKWSPNFNTRDKWVETPNNTPDWPDWMDNMPE